MEMFAFFRKRTRREGLLDLCGVVDDPREAWLRARGAPFLFEMPAARIRALGFAGSDPDNPFVVTLRDYAAGRCSAYQGSALEDFYRQWQPSRTAHDTAAGQPEPPWRESRRRPENTAAGRWQRAGFVDIARELGVRPEDIPGHITGGPVTEAFGEALSGGWRACMIPSAATDSVRTNRTHPTRAGRATCAEMIFGSRSEAANTA